MVKEWHIMKLGDIFDFKNGLNKEKIFFGSGTPIVNYMDVYQKSGLKKADIKGSVTLDRSEIDRYEVRKGDVFFTRTSETPDEVGIASILLEEIEDCVFSGFVLRARPKKDVLLPEYCKYCFSTDKVRKEIITNCTYTTRALTNGKQLSAIEIPVPDKKEQAKIATALSDIDNLISESEKLIRKYQAMKQGCLRHMFPRKGQTEPDMRLPGFSGAWEQRKLSAVVKEVKRTDETSMAPVMMITAENGFINQSERYSTNNAGQSLKKYILLEKGELAYNHGASKLRPFGSCFALTTEEEARIPFVYHCFFSDSENAEFLSIELNGKAIEKQLRRIVSSGARMDGY